MKDHAVTTGNEGRPPEAAGRTGKTARRSPPLQFPEKTAAPLPQTMRGPVKGPASAEPTRLHVEADQTQPCRDFGRVGGRLTGSAERHGK